jgi:hypothetical protein
VPVGESPNFLPKGDYFTARYAYMWKRDLKLIKRMGANTIRIYGWEKSVSESFAYTMAMTMTYEVK